MAASVQENNCTKSRATSRTGSSLSRCASSAFAFTPFGFDSKTAYVASEHLIKSRSDTFLLKPPSRDNDVWKRSPPDFRPQCYLPNPPKRNSREAMRPWRYATLTPKTEADDASVRQSARQSAATLRLPHLRDRNKEEEEEEGEFVTRNFNIPGPWESKNDYAKHGMNRPGAYQMPKPHDFRGIPPIQSLGLPEFYTDKDYDPYNLKFLSENLDILPGDGPAVRKDREIKGRQMAPPLTAKLHWDQKLIYPNDPFPNKSIVYTRHRRQGRSVHSALMERIEDKLNAQWAKEKLEAQLSMVSKSDAVPTKPQQDERQTMQKQSYSSVAS